MVFLVSGGLLGSRQEGQELLKNQKSYKNMVFIRFLKSNDQKNQKNIVFCMILKRPCSETYIKTMVFLVATFQKPMKKQCVFFSGFWKTLGKQAGRTRVSQKPENVL